MSVRRFFHWGPISVLVIIKLITWAMIHMIGMWWPPHTSIGAAVHAAIFLMLATSTLYYFLQSLLEGPGFVPLGWRPENEDDTEHLQYCVPCKGYKAPRAHHCRKCGRCVKKMDHHCPWINTCVGHGNHNYFTFFLFSAVLGCLHSTIVLSICLYHGLHRVWYIYKGTGHEPMVYLTLQTMLLMLLAVGISLGVVLAVGTLLVMQVRGILRNQTSIEEWIVEKAAARRAGRGLPALRYPYALGWRRALALVFRAPRADGLRWPLRAGCGPYDLTREQKAQKLDKRERSLLYTAVGEYSGRWVPLLQHPRAACAAPCSEEPRLPLRRGDCVRATRQRRHWLFGEKLIGGGETRGPRGWFPRNSVVPADAPNSLHSPLTANNLGQHIQPDQCIQVQSKHKPD